MATLRMIVLLALLILTGFFLGTVVQTNPEHPLPEPPQASLENPLSAEIQVLTEKLEQSQSEAKELRNRLARLREQLLARNKSKNHASSNNGLFQPTRTEGVLLSKLDETLAFALFEEAIAVGNMKSLLLLGADLLAFGEPGYKLFGTLLEEFTYALEGEAGRSLKRAFREEELYFGSFFRTLAESNEAFLSYGLYLASGDSELSPAERSFQEKLFDDDFLPVLLGFHGGKNEAISQGWTDLLTQQLAVTESKRVASDLMYALAQLPGVQPVNAIVDHVNSFPKTVEEGVRALHFLGSPGAIAEARRLLLLCENDELREELGALLD